MKAVQSGFKTSRMAAAGCMTSVILGLGLGLGLDLDLGPEGEGKRMMLDLDKWSIGGSAIKW